MLCLDLQRLEDVPEDRDEVGVETALTQRYRGNPPGTKPTALSALGKMWIEYPNNSCATAWKMTRCDKIASVSLRESRNCQDQLLRHHSPGEMTDSMNLKLLVCFQAIHMQYQHHTCVKKREPPFIEHSWTLTKPFA